jgi:hypothetical protein
MPEPPANDPADGHVTRASDAPPAARYTFAHGNPVPGLSSWVLERKLGGGFG